MTPTSCLSRPLTLLELHCALAGTHFTRCARDTYAALRQKSRRRSCVRGRESRTACRPCPTASSASPELRRWHRDGTPGKPCDVDRMLPGCHACADARRSGGGHIEPAYLA